MIYHVQGNKLSLAIELTLRTVEADGTNIEQTDVDFMPVGDVDVTLQSGARRWNYKFQARNSVVEFVDTGELPVGEYDIELFCRDLQGNRYRWKYRNLLTVVDCSEEAGVEQPVEFQTTAYSLQGIVTPLGSGGGISEETDPVFCASPAAGITQADIDRWDAGCGLAEIDPIFSYSPAARITNEDILRWNSGSDIHTIKKNGYPLYPDRTGAIDITGIITEVMVNGETVPLAEDGHGHCLLVLDIPEGEGTVTAVKMNNGTPIEPDANGVVNLGTVITQRQDISGKANSADLATVATSGSYNDLTDKPTIPEGADLTGYATEQYVNTAIAGLVDSSPETLDTLNELADALGDDPNFATTMATQLGNKVDKETGKSLMTDAEHTKLAGIAAGAEVNVNADWNASSGKAQILHKPTLATVATSGSYNDLSNKPTIPAAQVQSDWNASSGMGAILNKPTIPSKTSDLTNDSGFTSNAGTITGITMNGASKGTSGVVDLGTVITSHQDISGKANASDVYTKTQTDTLLAGKQNTLTFDDAPTANSNNPVKSGGIKTYVDGKVSITGITTNQDGTFTIAQSDGNSFTVDLNHTHPQYLKYQLLADEAAYNALATKDSGTLYLIPES